jgi:hypothetical protein
MGDIPRAILPLWLLGAAAAGAGEPGEAGKRVGFNAEVRPILSEKCFACHGFDAKTREAGLRLDTRAGALEVLKDSGRAAITPGKPEESEMIRRITSSDPEERMPPEEAHKEVSAGELAVVREWIRQGAEYEEHWAYTSLQRPPVPEVAGAAPIDAFVRARLAEKKLAPSAPAAAATLLRRLTLDLTGLPPSPEEVAEFSAAAAKDRPAAVAAAIERLLASPRYGERMAVPWLDAVRFADTVGFHGDQNQDIFPYRDYVIAAFNANKRFDEFTREQLAGDLLPEAGTEELVASGFNRLNMMTREGGAQPQEYLAKYAASRVRAIGTAWLGQTTGCAECHDHKFDPIKTKDFYALAAFFDDLRQWGVYTDYGYTPNPDLRGFTNDHPFPPQMLLRPESLEKRLALLRAEAPRLAPANHSVPAKWEEMAGRFLAAAADGWAVAVPVAVATKSQTPTAIQAGRVVLTGAPRKGETVTVEVAPEAATITALQLEVAPVAENGGNVGRNPQGGFTLKPEFALKRGTAVKPLAISWKQADRFLAKKYVNGAAPLALEDEWRSGTPGFGAPGDDNRQPHHAVFQLKEPLELVAGDLIVVTLVTDDLGSVKVATTILAEPVPGMAAAPPALAAALATPDARRTAAQRVEIAGAHALVALPENQLRGWKELRTSIRECRAGYALTMISQPLPKEKFHVTRVLPRGNWQDQSGEVVAPAAPHFLPQINVPAGQRATRLDLANWLVSKENPLTARHFVNRLWKQFFGSGLSNVLDDLGSQGEWPSHPELLDWLAAEFRDSGWDIKHLVRLIVSSATYQQEAATRPELVPVDPQNRLLASQAARRLDAEFIRDNALAIAGLLDTRLTGGPSVRPFQPAGYYTAIQFPSRDYLVQTDDQQFRRGVYMHWQRTFLHPMLAAFDAPAREECAADRLQSNSPQQALTLLNDPNFIVAAQALAAELVKLPDVDTRIRAAYQRALARDPESAEVAGLKKFIETTTEFFQKNPADAGKVAAGIPGDPAVAAAMVQFSRVILNLHETITRY